MLKSFRGGFTLVELLVVIAIIGILVALLLPAIQAAREAARRAQCSNNLKQLGIACQTYNDVHGRLPHNGDTGWTAYPGTPMAAWNSFSWIFNALPFMEQTPLYDTFKKNVQYGNDNDDASLGLPTNRTLRQTIIATLICPSNPQERLRTGWCSYAETWGNACGGFDYVGNLGHVWAGWKDCGSVPEFPAPAKFPNMFIRGASQGTPWVKGEQPGEQANYNGVFRENGSFRLSDILDGTANTIVVFENMHWRGGTPGNSWDTNFNDDSCWAAGVAAVHTVRNNINNKLLPDPGNVNDRRCSAWSSLHPGGAQAVMGDGVVRFFSENTDHVVRYKLGVRNDGFTVSF